MPYNTIFALLFIYSLFELRIPKHFWIILAGVVVTGAMAIVEPVANFPFLQISLIAVLIEAIRLMAVGVKEKRKASWIILIGFSLLILFSTYDMLLDFELMKPLYDINNGYPFGFVGLLVSMSVYLASDFARTNERILKHEREARELELERRVLEGEDARKSKELAEARELQLSMLPKDINKVNDLDICFEMKTATEVGGDYYDYFVSEDETLTLAIGDATGHGMKAGIMVSIIKSLFISDSGKTDLSVFFQKGTHIIKQMNLGNLFMALMLVRVKDGRMTASSAGMPPILIYRKATDSVEDITLKGMPLGAVESFSYETIETDLAPGDTVLLMSDGLPELFNESNEILDYPLIVESFRRAGRESPEQIIRTLLSTGDNWRGDRKQEDDITLVVLRA